MGWVKRELTPESYSIDREDYPRVVKQGIRHLEDVARACRDYMTEMRIVVAAVAAVAVAAVAGAVEREHSSDDWVSKERIVAAAAAAGHAGDCKQDCIARSLPAIAEDLRRHLRVLEEVLEMEEVPNLAVAA